jgi:hypothetical protein
MPCSISDGLGAEDGPAGALSEPLSDEIQERSMMSHEEFCAAMDEVRLSQRDIVKLTGKDRATVWRWQTGRSPVPTYAWTIVRDRKKIRELTLELCK